MYDFFCLFFVFAVAKSDYTTALEIHANFGWNLIGPILVSRFADLQFCSPLMSHILAEYFPVTY